MFDFSELFQRRTERDSDDFLDFLSCLKKGTIVFVLFLFVFYRLCVCVFVCFFLLKDRSGDVRFRGFL